MRSLALAVALTLVSIPGGAWAKTPGDTGPPIGQTETSPKGAVPTEIPVTQGPDYASREVQAKGLETFKGGDTVVIFGGSLVVIVLIVVLIVVLI